MHSLISKKEREFQIKTSYGFIGAKLWNENGKKTPILALHGWMDNAGTWDHICPFLDSDHPLVAIDAAGHGLSSPCLGMGSYITDNLVTMERVLLYLQWNKVILLGHSMGGITAMMYAAAMPNKVEKLIAIDLLKLIHIDAENQPRITSLSLENIFEAERKIEMKPVRYKYTDLVRKLIESYGSGLKAESAMTLLKRGAREHDDGTYSFTHSPITKVSETLSTTLEQQEAFASRVECDFLFIKAASSELYVPKEEAALFLRLFRRNPKFVFEVVEGTHHVHLDDPKPVAAIINAFLRRIPQKKKSKQRSDAFIKSML